jgi:hypothetical protein
MSINIMKEGSCMKGAIIALLAFALAPDAMAEEMSVEDKIKSAMSAAPTRIAKNATILDSDGTVLREGSNKWTCKPGGPPGSKRYPICNDPVFMKWSETVWNGKPFSTDTVGYSYMLAGGFAADVFDPHVSKVDAGENSHHEGPHMMLIMPSHDLLADQSGDPKDDDIFVLFKNTDHEIVIIPLGDVITE